MNFVADANLPERLAKMLHLFDGRNTIEHLTDLGLDPAAPDVDWLYALPKHRTDPVVLTRDRNILEVAREVEALRKVNLHFVCLTGKWVGYPMKKEKGGDLAWRLVRAWGGITEAVGQSAQPAIFTVNSSGKVTLLKLASEL